MLNGLTGDEMKKSLLPGVATLLAFVLLVSLGTWQVRRMAWKTALIENLHKRLDQPPVALQEVINRFHKNASVEYQPVTVRGTFLHKTEKHLYALDDKGRPGWHIYTLMELKGSDCASCQNRNRFVYVNRGFVPYELKNRGKRPQGQVSAKVEFIGLVRIPRTGKSYGEANNNPGKNEWYWPSLKEMSSMDAGISTEQAAQLVPFFVDERKQVKVPGKYFGKYDGKFYKWPRAGVTRINIANRHLGYVITWYGLALALLGVYGFFVYGNKRRNTGD